MVPYTSAIAVEACKFDLFYMEGTCVPGAENLCKLWGSSSPWSPARLYFLVGIEEWDVCDEVL